ncbi:transmembrane protein 169 isoform X1 [Nilaparvata lugens]|uniref:transmembrane protein 169 isoform X1 n=1 Tax=Nilaparvata lugens TaxID=108931 RepID=UPI000B981E02|nr:transmembrane protein 169 isoform X1 [Nilaparvata lugens]
MEVQPLAIHDGSILKQNGSLHAEPKVNGTTNLLPAINLNLQLEKLIRSTSSDDAFCHIGPRFLVDGSISPVTSCPRNGSAAEESDLAEVVTVKNGHAISVENGHASAVEDEDTKSKKRVNICTDEAEETTTLRRSSETSESGADRSVVSTNLDKCLTMTGTIKRGKKAGQNLDVRLNISREELEVLEANMAAKENQSFTLCGFTKGLHIFLWTLLCFPVATLISSIYSFYIGTLMWHNIFTYVTEEKNLLYRILLSPFLIIFFPFFIILFTLGLGIYAGLIQISWYLDSWSKEIMDWEKGFYGWLCSLIGLEDCSPYEVVVLTDIQVSTTTNDEKKLDDSQNSIPDLNI